MAGAKLGIPNLAQMFQMKSYLLVKNAKFKAFTITKSL